MKALVNDVIQLDPAHCRWGPLLCIVDKVQDWGVRCYALVPGERGSMYLNVNHGDYYVVGRAEWVNDAPGQPL